MKQKRSKKILIILIILVMILILLLGFAYLYFSTDILKSNKQLFFRYAGQMGNTTNGFIDSKLKEYFNNKKIFTIENNGSVSVNITSNKANYENVNNMDVTFSGISNKSNLYNKQEIDLNYSDEVKFPIIYKQDGSKIGIQTDYVGSKYIVADTADLEGVIDENIENSNKIQKITELQSSQENIIEIIEKYMNIVYENVSEEAFSKIEENNTKGYKLYLEGQELQNIVKKINENLEFNEQSIEIIIYKAEENTNRISIKAGQIEMILEKIANNNELKYNITIKNDENTEVNLVLKFTNIDTRQNINENYEVTVNSRELEYKLNYNNNINLIESSNFEPFNTENSIILNDMDKNKKDTLISAITERIQVINKQQMEKLNLKENKNPIIQMVTAILGETINNQISNSINNSMEDTIESAEIVAFNKKFEVYKSTNLQGTTVKGLLSTINLNNESMDDDRQITEIHFNGEEFETTEQTIASLKSEVELETYYKVEFEMNEETGVIYRAVINKK